MPMVRIRLLVRYLQDRLGFKDDTSGIFSSAAIANHAKQALGWRIGRAAENSRSGIRRPALCRGAWTAREWRSHHDHAPIPLIFLFTTIINSAAKARGGDGDIRDRLSPFQLQLNGRSFLCTS